MSVKRATYALAVVCAAFGWSNSASAVTYPTCTLPVACGGGNYNGTQGASDTDRVNVIIAAPVDPAATGGLVALFTPVFSELSSFSYQWRADAVPGSLDAAILIQSGSLNTSSQNILSLPLTATTPAGQPYSYYELFISYTTSGLGGGGYSWTLGATCSNAGGCAPPPPAVPVPPAAILFVSGLAGLGLLGRKRRKGAQV
jgi:hypothetical protein